MTESRAHPAIIIVARSQHDLPPVADVEGIVIDALEETWGNPGDMVRGIHRDVVQFQDEVPPRPPVEREGIVVSFGQLPITMYDENASPFRLVTKALDDAFNSSDDVWEKQIEMSLDAVRS